MREIWVLQMTSLSVRPSVRSNSVRPYAAPQENQCKWYTQGCESVAAVRVCLAGSCLTNCVLEKQKEILKTAKYKVNLCIRYSGQQREK